MANEIEIVVTSKDKTDFRAISAKARTAMQKSVKDGLDDVEKTTADRFKTIGDHSGKELSNSLSAQLKRWSPNIGDHVTVPMRASFDRATQEIDVRVKTKFKEVGQHSGSALAGGLKGGLSGLPGVGADAGASTGNSFSRAMAQSLNGMGAYLIPVLIAALVSLAPAIGGLLATGIVLAFGAGLAGLGLAASFGLKSVQKSFGSFKKFLSGFMKDIGKPFEETWKTIFSVAGNVLKTLQPILKGAFKDFIAPAVTRFVLDLGKAFVMLGPAIRPVAKAFSLLLGSIGKSLPGIFKGIATAMTTMADTISKDPDLFANFITGLMQLVVWGMKAIAFLAKIYKALSDFTHTKNPSSLMFAALAPTAGLMMHFGKSIYNLSQTLGAATRKAYRFTVTGLNKAGKPVADAIRLATSFARRQYRAALTAISKVSGPASAAARACTTFAKRQYRAALTAISKVSGVVSAAARACTSFARRQYRAALTAVNRVAAALSAALSMGRTWARQVFTATFNVFKAINPFKASGGIVGGLATGGMPRGQAGGGPGGSLTWVGEQGAELVRLPTGSQVYPHGQSKGMAERLGGGGAQQFTFEVVGGSSDLEKLIVQILRNFVRITKGSGPNSVQSALGGR